MTAKSGRANHVTGKPPALPRSSLRNTQSLAGELLAPQAVCYRCSMLSGVKVFLYGLTGAACGIASGQWIAGGFAVHGRAAFAIQLAGFLLGTVAAQIFAISMENPRQ